MRNKSMRFYRGKNYILSLIKYIINLCGSLIIPQISLFVKYLLRNYVWIFMCIKYV